MYQNHKEKNIKFEEFFYFFLEEIHVFLLVMRSVKGSGNPVIMNSLCKNAFYFSIHR